MKKYFPFILGVLVFALLVYLSSVDPWKYHLSFDVRTFFHRYQEFKADGNFSSFTSNEYLPLSLFFFLVPGLFANLTDAESYQGILTLINLLLMGGHIFLYHRINPKTNPYIYLLLFLLTGPILLFRFELFVSLLVLLAIYFFTTKKTFLSGLFMGLSIATKVYPLFLVPYFLIIYMKKEEFKKMFKFALSCALGAGVPVFVYYLMSGDIKDLLKNLIYHVEKPVGIESIISSLISMGSVLGSGKLPEIIAQNGIWGIPDKSLSIINYLPYVAVFLFYEYQMFNREKEKHFNPLNPVLVILIFLVTSKYLNPQYLFWAFGLLPLWVFGKTKMSYLTTISVFAVLIFTQFVYPIYFSDLLNSYQINQITKSFYILQIRNIALIASVIFLFKLASNKK